MSINVERIAIRPAVEGDEQRLLQWRNDPLTRRMSLSHEFISPEVHHYWFVNMLNNSSNFIFIGKYIGQAIGMVRFDCVGKGFLKVNIVVDAAYRSKGVGTYFLSSCISYFIETYFRPAGFVAEVLTCNEASLRLFKSVGFIEEIACQQQASVHLVLMSEFFGKSITVRSHP